MIQKPQNHVTRRGQHQDGPRAPALPEVPEDLLKALEAAYPPRCLTPRETVEDHLRYAGAVDLIARLRREHDARQNTPDLEEDDFGQWVNGERIIP